MVDFKLTPLDINNTYKFEKCANYSGCGKRFAKTVANINKMLATGHKIIVVIPSSSLSDEEREEYRAYFCKAAKETGVNYVYFDDDVQVSVCDPFEGTMFE